MPVFSFRSTMFPASLLVLMTLLLPQALSGRQGGSSHSDGNLVSPLESSLAQTIQNLLLTRLGLQSHPSPHPGAVVPQYLLDLYRFHTEQFHLIEDPDFSFPTEHVQKANTVRSFHHAGKSRGLATKSSDCFGSLSIFSSALTEQSNVWKPVRHPLLPACLNSIKSMHQLFAVSVLAFRDPGADLKSAPRKRRVIMI